MSTTIDQKAYLQKYLSGPTGDKKKKKKKVSKGKGFKIIDDDLDLSKLRPLEGDELDVLGEGDDAPQIAGIIDDRPEEVKKMEQFKTNSKWRVINQDDGFVSNLKIEEIQQDIKETEKENELVFGKMYSDSEDEKNNDSDLSPPRKQAPNTDKPKSKPQNSDSDVSPPRRYRNRSTERKEDLLGKHDNQKPKERARKASRWGELETKERDRSKSNSPRRSKKQRTHSPSRKRKSPDSDVSPPRKSQKVRKDYDSDLSPPRKSRKESPKKNRRKQSPDDKRERHSKQKSDDRSYEKSRRSRKPSTSDGTPPRDKPQNKRHKSPSPARQSRKHSPERNRNNHDSDSDLSPPRKGRNRNAEYRRDSSSPPPSNKKMAKTLDGKMAGLQDAKQLKQENDAFRKREEEAFSKMTDEVSGRNAKAVSRKGKRDTSEDRQKLREKAERQKMLDEKYKKWSKGVKQVEAQEARVQDYLHEAAKPLARHKDDKDLENRLKDVERDGDPMLRYIREKKRERGELGPEKPQYKGNFPPNRFNIRPGYRWDGVDRSNGYEKKYFEHQSKRRAQEEEAYKWSTEDL